MRKSVQLVLVTVLMALVIAIIPFSSALADGPVVTEGADPQATLQAGVRYKDFGNSGDGAIYVGKPADLGTSDREETDYNWGSSNTVTFTYEVSGTVGADLLAGAERSGHTRSTDPYEIGYLDALNYLEIQLCNRGADDDSLIGLNNVLVNGHDLGSFSVSGGDGWKTWSVKGIDLTDGFTLTGSLVLSGTVDDGELDKIQVNAGSLPEPVVANDDNAVTDEEVPVGIEVLANDDPDTVILAETGEPAHGRVTSNDAISVTYTPDEDFHGFDTFSYTVSDGAVTDTAIVTVTVNPINDRPVALDDTAETDEDESVDIDLLHNDDDPDGDALSVDEAGEPSDGYVTDDAAGTVTYTPDEDFHGTDTFTYTVSDSTLTDTATVNVTVHPINDRPVALDDKAETDEDESVDIDLLHNDDDPDGDALSVDEAGEPSDGYVTDNGDGTVTYTPDEDFHGTDTFTYTVSDGTLTDTATVEVKVLPVNDPPLAVDDQAATEQDTPVQISVTDNDSDPDGTLDAATVVTATSPAHGSVSGGSAGLITYTPEPGYTGSDSFLYELRDDQGATSNQATVTVNIAAAALPQTSIYLPFVARSTGSSLYLPTLKK